MRTRTIRPLAAGVGLVCAATVARADTTSDIKNATQLFVNYAHVTMDGVGNEATIRFISKPAGTLTFDIPAAALGFPLADATLHATGTAIGGGQIAFTTSDTYSPPITIDDAGDTVWSESGSFTMQTRWLTGAEAPDCGHDKCTGGTAFSVLGGSIRVTGSFGTKTVTLDELRGIGGVPRAALAGLNPPPMHLGVKQVPELPFCSGTIQTHAHFELVLGAPAQAGGARVDLSSPAQGIRFPATFLVPQGRDRADIDVEVPAKFAGTFALTAAAGGQTSTATLDVHAAGTCAPPTGRYTLVPLAEPSIVGCTACSAFRALNNEGDALIAVNGVLELAHAGTYTSLAKQWGSSSIGADSINDVGEIAGRVTIAGVAQAYRADMLHGAHAPVLLGGMTPMAITVGGAVVGYRVDATTGYKVPVINRGFGVVDVPLASPYGVRAARALFMTQDATIVGTYTGNDGVVRGYRYAGGGTTTLPAIGGNPSIPVGITRTGAIAVNAGTVAALVAPDGSVGEYGNPAGYTQFTVTDINKWGYAIGVATESKTSVQRAFVYIPGTGFVVLSGYVSTLAYADQALAINDDNQIVLHGQLVKAQQADLYVLSL